MKSRKSCKHGVNQYGCCNKKPSVKKTDRCLEYSKRRSSPCKYGEDVNGCCNKKPTKKYVKKCKRSRRSRDLASNKDIVKKIIKSLRKSRKPCNNKYSEQRHVMKSKNDSADFNMLSELLSAATGGLVVGAGAGAYKYYNDDKNSKKQQIRNMQQKSSNQKQFNNNSGHIDPNQLYTNFKPPREYINNTVIDKNSSGQNPFGGRSAKGEEQYYANI